MPNMKQIKSKINSVSNIKKITKALEVVSTVKLQKIKEKTERYRDFMMDFLYIVYTVQNKINIFKSMWDVDPNKKKLIIVMSSDRGLCGSLNNKVFRHIFEKYQNEKDKVCLFCVWKKAFEFFVRSGFDVVGYTKIWENLEESSLNDLYSFLTDALDNRSYSEIKMYFNFFKNTITQIPLRFKLFPLDKESFDTFVENLDIKMDQVKVDVGDKFMICEPNNEIMKDELKKQLLQHMIYWAALQNKAWEYAARMMAMKNAKDNSEEIIDYLKLSFNKARQTVITQEVSEIMGAKMAIDA